MPGPQGIAVSELGLGCEVTGFLDRDGIAQPGAPAASVAINLVQPDVIDEIISVKMAVGPDEDTHPTLKRIAAPAAVDVALVGLYLY